MGGHQGRLRVSTKHVFPGDCADSCVMLLEGYELCSQCWLEFQPGMYFLRILILCVFCIWKFMLGGGYILFHGDGSCLCAANEWLPGLVVG